MRLRETGDRRSGRAPAALLAIAALALPAAVQPSAAAEGAAFAPGAGGPAAPPREVVFVVDLSEAMRGVPLEQAKAALAAAIESLRPVDTFNVLALGERTRALFPASWPARPGSLERAARWIAGLESDGSAEVLRGLSAALGPPDEGYSTPGTRARREVVVFAPGAIGRVWAGEAAAAPPAPRAPSGGQAQASGRPAAGATASLLLRLGAGLALFAAALAYALRRGLAAPEAAR